MEMVEIRIKKGKNGKTYRYPSLPPLSIEENPKIRLLPPSTSTMPGTK
jgi:hypothetical protein